ncbi:hypothetical protein F5Y17DRAFT_417590 [Xylariaceae sp. FL0594]|nr:hypothetical protein F5Y17DRAFT_417590 [Xylariaceae sp. FL0594]
MSKQSTIRRYGRQNKKPPKAGRLFVELPQTPIRMPKTALVDEDAEDDEALLKLTHDMSSVKIRDENIDPIESPLPARRTTKHSALLDSPEHKLEHTARLSSVPTPPKSDIEGEGGEGGEEVLEDRPIKSAHSPETKPNDNKVLQVLTWADVCPPGDRIEKIAEASYAEVYRVTNERGTSIIKVIRMESPIKPQTKAQQKAGLVDEEPHPESDLMGELKISEWLADIPGFVVYKERYIVKGKACRELLETHQAFHKKVKRQDPDRLQFYPSPSRYLDDTKFLVVELGDAGTSLEGFELVTADQLWDIFFHVAIALARAEAKICFEHRDLHEGNLCIRKVGDPIPKEKRVGRAGYFGFSGLEITILDYGLSRAQADAECDPSSAEPIAYDLERDLSVFTSEHAPQCRVYRQMRSFLLRGDRICLPPEEHNKPYAPCINVVDGNEGERVHEGEEGEPISWSIYEPYTNVLWLAYLYEWMTDNFRGPKKEVGAFRRATRDLWRYMNPDAGPNVPGFESASDILRYAVESGWVDEDQLMGGGGSGDEMERSALSILATLDEADVKAGKRRPLIV